MVPGGPVTKQDVFILTDQALKAVVGSIRDDQWSSVVPDDMTRTPGVTLRRLGDKYADDLLGDRPKLNFASIVETAILAVRGFDDLERTAHLSYGDWPAREYLKHSARFIGTDTMLPPDLVQGLWGEIEPSMEEWRKLGVYGPAVPVPEGAPPQDRLLGLPGRQPA
jgi:hypothetical protein